MPYIQQHIAMKYVTANLINNYAISQARYLVKYKLQRMIIANSNHNPM